MQIYTHPTYPGASICTPTADITSLPTAQTAPTQSASSSSSSSSSNGGPTQSHPPANTTHQPPSPLPTSTSYPPYLQNYPYPQQFYSYAQQPMSGTSGGYPMMAPPTHFPSGKENTLNMYKHQHTLATPVSIYPSTYPYQPSSTHLINIPCHLTSLINTILSTHPIILSTHSYQPIPSTHPPLPFQACLPLTLPLHITTNNNSITTNRPSPPPTKPIHLPLLLAVQLPLPLLQLLLLRPVHRNQGHQLTLPPSDPTPK